jgi:hypothetical protein
MLTAPAALARREKTGRPLDLRSAASHVQTAAASRGPGGRATAGHCVSLGMQPLAEQVATGAHNIEDPFCPLGRADPFDAARLLALTAHLDPAEAWRATSGSARRIVLHAGVVVAETSVTTTMATDSTVSAGSPNSR